MARLKCRTKVRGFRLVNNYHIGQIFVHQSHLDYDLTKINRIKEIKG